ncbi:hypothetical protein F442_22412 [Phytophthora nicotianae P10297]|uniref:Uncharacterized protein n=1 Tax=Phytophthora nicotianae P10297 TaxID=1317064 RepID=W2XZM7_PHYNI|nr:hypothetical protein F442_22412 [Phytophthora nicotianae P10297]
MEPMYRSTKCFHLWHTMPLVTANTCSTQLCRTSATRVCSRK